MREIDTVTVKGSIKPMRLFTIDVQTDDLQAVDDPMGALSIKEKKQIRDQMKNDLIKRLWSGEITTWEEFNADHDFRELRKKVDDNFEQLFAEAYQSYIKGEWNEAGNIIDKLIKIRPNDGPLVSLNKVININGKK